MNNTLIMKPQLLKRNKTIPAPVNNKHEICEPIVQSFSLNFFYESVVENSLHELWITVWMVWIELDCLHLLPFLYIALL